MSAFVSAEPVITHPDSDDLFAEARRIRARRTGSVVTYSRKVFIPLTNLCRDRCAYCTFARQPGDGKAHTMSPEEVLAVAEAGKRAGCKEALFSLGDKPEARYPQHREWLERQGFASTIEYLAAMCQLVFEQTGLLPHSNPGAMTGAEIELLRPVNVSLGMMLESKSARLLERGQAHYACPDKAPAVRLATVRAAGEARVAFTSGILIGIGETFEERVDALVALRDLHRQYGHLQEVIIQNFRAKPDIPFAHHAEPDSLDLARTVAMARSIFGGEVSVQAPPNLNPAALRLLLDAGINDWGGISPVTLDHINPEHEWPHLPELKRVTESAGLELRERLPLYPNYLTDTWIPEAFRDRVDTLASDDGLVKREWERW
ncbi:MAG: 7,8-didemethyl-8-hydroxy-5-deazariboflavin synthase CofG [Bryobacterales bacterium]|nr:7,8-didemethyl-8-hydroxy-5-deazariboflavin synthase CofG [Bryobacterales bacterium]